MPIDLPEEPNLLYAALAMVCDPENDYVWRVDIHKDGGVTCKYIGYITIDTAQTVEYQSLQETPEWVQNGVAVLRMLPADIDLSLVKGLGRRISEDLFWVVQPMETIG